jgi:uncharacterized protein
MHEIMDLISAVKTDDVRCVQEKLKVNWDLITLERCLYFAIKQGNSDIACLILSAASNNASDDRNSCSIVKYHHLEEAIFQGNIDLVKPLLEQGAAYYVQHEVTSDSDEPTILMLASQEGYFEIVKLLVDAGADVNVSRQGGLNALLSAASNGHEAIFNYLYSLTDSKFYAEATEALEYGIRMRNFQQQANPRIIALNTAILEGRYAEVQSILNTGIDVNSPDSEGCTAIFIAVLKNSRKLLHTLLKAGANPNLGNMMDGRTPLMILNYYWNRKSLEICNLLLEFNADINITDHKGFTPLMHLVLPLEDDDQKKAIKYSVIDRLIKSSANVDCKDFEVGKNALMHVLSEVPRNKAAASDQQEISKVLTNAGSSK